MKRIALGVDIGGTTIKMGLVDAEGSLLDKWNIPTRTEDAGIHIVEDIAASLRERLESGGVTLRDLEGIGVGVPGVVLKSGVVAAAVNLGWKDLELASRFEAALGMPIPVKIANDANAAALGEVWQGGGKGCQDMILITLGTGLGSGVIVDGHILAGSGGVAGEIGHMHVRDKEKERCNCGGRGCLEQYVSATGIKRLAQRRLQSSGKPSSLRGRRYVTVKDVFSEAEKGDEIAAEVLREFGKVFGKALAAVCTVINPELILLGGGVSGAGRPLVGIVLKYFRRYAFRLVRKTRISLATLGNDAGIYGAARLILEDRD